MIRKKGRIGTDEIEFYIWMVDANVRLYDLKAIFEGTLLEIFWSNKSHLGMDFECFNAARCIRLGHHRS